MDNLCLQMHNHYVKPSSSSSAEAPAASVAPPLLRHAGLAHDVNLLLVLRLLLQTGNVSEAARQLESSQPAISRTLERLRVAFNDPLLIKSGSRMSLTPRAEELRPLLEQLATLLEAVYRVPEDYRLDQVARTCVIGLNDSLQAFIGPALLRMFRERAPRASLTLVPLAHHIPQKEVYDGALDLMIGISASKEAQLRRASVFTCGYVCVSSADHPLPGACATLEDIASHPYLEASNTGVLTAITDRMFMRAGVRKRVVATTSSFLAAGECILGTDMVFIAPGYIAPLISTRPGLRCTPLSSDEEPYGVSMYWHNAKHADPFWRDVRAMVAEVGRTLSLQLS